MRARTRRASALATIVACIGVACARDARADETSSVTAATVLFDEAVALLDAGRPAEACPKLARSHALAPSGGTLLALGDCYVQIGKTASAWLAFREAAARAAGAGKSDAEAFALQRASQLVGSLRRLTVRVSPEAKRTPDLEVRRDGVVLKDAELGVAVPVDPGPHEIEAEAPTAEKWSRVVSLDNGESIEVTIPTLMPKRVAIVTALEPVHEVPRADGPAKSTSDSTGRAQRVAGLVVAGVGVASVAVGSIFGLLAKSANDEAVSKHCPNAPRCDAVGLDLTEDAKTRALESTLFFVVGAVALASGGILYFTAPRPAASRLRVAPTWGAKGIGATATLSW